MIGPFDLDDIVYDLTRDESGCEVDVYNPLTIMRLRELLLVWIESYVIPEKLNTFKSVANMSYGRELNIAFNGHVSVVFSNTIEHSENEALQIFNWNKLEFIVILTEYCVNCSARGQQRKYYELVMLFLSDIIDSFEKCDIAANITIYDMFTHDYDGLYSTIRIENLSKFLIMMKAHTNISCGIGNNPSKYTIHRTSHVVRMFIQLMKNGLLDKKSLTAEISKVLWTIDELKTLPEEYLSLIAMMAVL